LVVVGSLGAHINTSKRQFKFGRPHQAYRRRRAPLDPHTDKPLDGSVPLTAICGHEEFGRLLLEMKCKVESTSELLSQYRFTFEQKEVTLTPSINEEGKSIVSQIAITKRIPDSAHFKTSVTSPGPEGIAAEIRVQGAEELEEELKEDLQFLESLLSLSMVTKIEWESPERSFVPESEAEKQDLAVYSFRKWRIYPKVYMPLKTHLLNGRTGKFRELTVPLAFFREGVRSSLQSNYIVAFQDFYYVIEGFYAQGEYRDQERLFTCNDELLHYATAAFRQITRIWDKLEPFFTFYKLDKTPESFLRLAVKIRHRVHHYFHGGESGEYFGNPLRQDFYEPLALALNILCAHVLFGKIHSAAVRSGA